MESHTTLPNFKEMDGADISLVYLVNNKPHCTLHGAMNRTSIHGAWRCVGVYFKFPDSLNKRGNPIKGRFIEGTCRAGCHEVD